MHFQWMFIFLLVSCWITPTEETKGSWGISSLLSTLIHGDHEIESETVMERSLSRRKRATGVTEYTVDIEISFPDPSFANQIKQFIANNLTFPIPLSVNDTEIIGINVTQACNQTGSSVQCSCESGYSWPSTVCKSYITCPESNASQCNCITGSSIPTDYCRPKTVSIKLCLRIFRDYTADLKDETSALYQKYKVDLEEQFANTYKSLTGFISATITGFRSGSIVVDYTVVTEPVSTSALTTANQNLVNNLQTKNYSVDSIKTVINDQSFITVSPSNIFSKDTVKLNCTVNISSYTSVAWYFNGTIQSASDWTTTGSSPVQSIFTISRASINNSGTYLCIVDNGLTSYQKETTIVVQPLTMTILESNVTCNNLDIPIIQCCTEGLSMDFELTCSYMPGIPGGIARNNTTCKTYTVSADEKTCATTSGFGSYDCTCSTTYGAKETRNVKVLYQNSYAVTVNSKSDAISEGRELSMTCNCNAPSVNSISWFFKNNNITSQYSTAFDPTSCKSTLTIPSNILTVAWSGTYLCLVDTGANGTVSGSKQITVAKLVKPEQIILNHVSSDFQCNEDIYFSCCINDTTGYKKAELQIFTTSGTKLPSQDMTITDQCFMTTYTPKDIACVDFIAQCFITNEINDNVTSLSMNLALVKSAVTVNSNSDGISERSVLIVNCNCNATSVNSISWFFQNKNNPISSQYISTNRPSCKSTLTIPSNILTVAWSGTYFCSVDTGANGIVSGSKQITVAKLVKPEQINISPVSINFKCDDDQDFSCCISDTTGYKKAELQIFTTSGTKLSSQDMTITNQCFMTTYTPKDIACVDFTARCVITNEINDNVTSLSMNLRLVKYPNCTTPYVGELNSVIEVSCRDDDPKLTGTKKLICVKSENTAATWQNYSSDCVSAALNDIKNQLDALTSPESKQQIPGVLANLSNTVTTEKEKVSTSTNNIQLVVTLLEKVNERVTKVETNVMKDFLQTVDIVVDNPATWKKFSDGNRTAESSSILRSVEKFAEKLSINKSVEIKNNSNIQLYGDIISNLPNDYLADFKFNLTDPLTGNVTINRTTLDGLPHNATVVSVAYSTLKDILLTNGSNSSIQGEINGLVMTTTVTANYTNFKIEMDFKKSNTTLNNATCVFWNFNISDWDSSGCHPVNNSDSTMVTCVCDHLTSFSILMSYNYTIVDNKTEEILTYISYFGLGISILSLVICIILEATIWKSVTKNKTSYMRHICIMNISVTLLMADIWFIIGGVMSDSGKVDACVAATFFTHVFYLCTFFWMLTMGLILFYRLMCVFHDLSKKVMMGISFFLGYGCPIIISVITVAVTQPSKKYTNDKACWLKVEESHAFLAFIIPALTILLVNFITLFVVIIKVLRPSVGDRPKKEEKSTLNHIAKCILILTPLLGLTWGFGIGTLSSNHVAIHGIFSALNGLQGLFILLFGCLMDKKVRDALFSRFSISRWSSQQTKTSNLSTSDPVFSKGIINLFAKKGVYNISSAQASSSSEMSNSYSLLT